MTGFKFGCQPATMSQIRLVMRQLENISVQKLGIKNEKTSQRTEISEFKEVSGHYHIVRIKDDGMLSAYDVSEYSAVVWDEVPNLLVINDRWNEYRWNGYGIGATTPKLKIKMIKKLNDLITISQDIDEFLRQEKLREGQSLCDVNKLLDLKH